MTQQNASYIRESNRPYSVEEELHWCPRCQRMLPADEFYRDKRTKSGRSSWCKECFRAYQRERYHRGIGKDKNAKMLDRRRQNKALLIKALGGECQRCGYKEFDSAFEFHHVQGKDKAATIAKLLTTGDISAMLEEADKCVLLCACCHGGFHFGEWKGEFTRRNTFGWTLRR